MGLPHGSYEVGFFEVGLIRYGGLGTFLITYVKKGYFLSASPFRNGFSFGKFLDAHAHVVDPFPSRAQNVINGRPLVRWLKQDRGNLIVVHLPSRTHNQC